MPRPHAGQRGPRPLPRQSAQQRKEHAIRAVAVRPQLHGGPWSEVIDFRQEIAGVLEHDIVTTTQHVGDDELRLPQMRRARHIRDDSTRPHRGERGTKKVSLQAPEGSQVGGCASPPGLRATAQCAQTRARRIDEDPVEHLLTPGRMTSIASDHDGTRIGS